MYNKSLSLRENPKRPHIVFFFPTFNPLVCREFKIGQSVSDTVHCSNFHYADSPFVHVGINTLA
jgi:hypothetical protein